MRIRALLWVGVCLLSFSARAEVYVQVNGVVTDARVPFGPWVDVQVGDPASMVFAVPEEGAIVEPDHLSAYPALVETFVMTINDVAVGLRDSVPPTALFVSNDFPIADAFVIAPDIRPMSEPSHGLLFELHDSTGTAWGSP